MKKLRYSIYFFESLFDGHAGKKVLSKYKDCLADLQDSLGALNDIAVHQRMITRLRNDMNVRDRYSVSKMVNAAATAKATSIRYGIRMNGFRTDQRYTSV